MMAKTEYYQIVLVKVLVMVNSINSNSNCLLVFLTVQFVSCC